MRRGTSAHLAHLVCETYLRLQSVGLAEHYFEVTQAEIGDILGISLVHVNRIIQEMRWPADLGTAIDYHHPHWKRLADAGQFDPTCLYLGRLPR